MASGNTPRADATPLRIAYLVSRYPAVSHTFILREVLALRGHGIDIDIASINAPPPLLEMTPVEQQEAARTFYVKRAGATGLLKAVSWILVRHPLGLLRGLAAAVRLGKLDPARVLLCLAYFGEALLLARWMHRLSLSHLHVHFATPAATVALILTQTVPVTMSMTVHGPDEFYDVSAYFLPQKIAAARFVLCISFFAQSQLMKLTPGDQWDKFDIARLGVDTAHFGSRQRPSIPGPVQILCVGRLVATKGQRILIRAAAQLLLEGRSIHLRFIGDGPDRSSLESLVSDLALTPHVSFEGSINQDHIRSFYETADIFATASFAEGIPVVLMEAMSMEIPCIATSINGIPELIRDHIDGLLVAPSDTHALTAAIARLIDDPVLRDTLGRAGRLRIQQEYDLSRSIDRLAHIFRSRLGHTS